MFVAAESRFDFGVAREYIEDPRMSELFSMSRSESSSSSSSGVGGRALLLLAVADKVGEAPESQAPEEEPGGVPVVSEPVSSDVISSAETGELGDNGLLAVANRDAAGELREA